MSGNSSFKTVVTVAAISSLVQGIILFVLSLLAILCYACVITTNYKIGNPLTHRDILAAYFQDSSCDVNLNFFRNNTSVSSPDKVLVYSIFVYIFNFFLLNASINILFAVHSKRKYITFSFLSFYIVISFCVAILDLITTGMVTSDYFEITNSDLQLGNIAGVTLLVLIIISCRGIFLWVANFAFSLYLVSFFCRKKAFQHELPQLTRSNIAPYQNNPSTSPQQEGIFTIDSKAMENRPVVWMDSVEELSKEYPSYSAQSRWPRLQRDAKLERPTTLPTSNHLALQERQQKHQLLQQQLQHQLQDHLQQQNQQKLRLQNKTPPSPPPKPIQPGKISQQNGNGINPQEVGTEVRPKSLQEAILTTRQFKNVRPRITAIPDGYP